MGFNSTRWGGNSAPNDNTGRVITRSTISIDYSASINLKRSDSDITYYYIDPLMGNTIINIDTSTSYLYDSIYLYLVNSGSARTVTFGSGFDCSPITVSNNIVYKLQFNGSEYIPYLIPTGTTSGSSGANGQSSSVFSYRSDGTNIPPNTGYISYDNPISSSSNHLYVSHETADNDDIDPLLGLITLGQIILIQKKSDSTKYEKWKVNGAPTTVTNSYWTYPVVLVDSTYNFSNNESVLLFITTSGTSSSSGSSGSSGTSSSAGSSGTSGSSGINGSSGSSGNSYPSGNFGVSISGSGGVITTGSKGYLSIPYACTITGWTLIADQTGSIVVDVRRSTYSGFPTTVSIAGTNLPTLSAAQKATDPTLVGWGNTSIAANDIIEFVVNSASTVTVAQLIINVTKI